MKADARITLDWLQRHNACPDGVAWWRKQRSKTLEGLWSKIKQTPKGVDWANWAVARLLSVDDRVRYAVYAARGVLQIFEARHPDDSRPRRAIEVAEKCLDCAAADAARAASAASAASRAASDAAAAAYAAAAASDAASAASDAARAASDADTASAASAASYAARAASYAANAASDTANAAACATSDAAYDADAAARAAELKKIIEHGLALVKKSKEVEA